MPVKGFLLDVEGTLVADKRYLAIGGAVEFVRAVRESGRPLRVITNNTTDTKASLHAKLTRAGFDFAIGELHTCIGAAAEHLRGLGVARCLVLGVGTLRDMFAEEGFTVVQASDVGAVVVGLDTDFSYDRLQLACDAIHKRGAALIALHRNRLFIDEEGRSSPSVGAIAEAIAYATQVEPTVIGKPSPAYFRQALKDLALPPESVLVVSDDPLTDLAGAKRMGMKTAFVLTGKYRDRSVIESVPVSERPDLVVHSVGELLRRDGLAC